MNRAQKRIYLLVLIFSVAMGFLEAVVVVYLRKIFYPNGFDFPLALLPPKMYYTELFRELATLIMLVTLALMAGKNKLERFAYFLFAFAVWDIVYYAGLKLLVQWPPSIMTWDILFLIPLPWVGPVLAPLICSLSMILLALGMTSGQEKVHNFRIRWIEWELIIVGAFLVFCSFIWEYGNFLLSIGITEAGAHIREVLVRFSPDKFPWGLFIPGEALILLAIFLIWRQRFRKPRNE